MTWPGLPLWRSGDAAVRRVSSHTPRGCPFGIPESHPRGRFLPAPSSDTAAFHRTEEHHAYSRVHAAYVLLRHRLGAEPRPAVRRGHYPASAQETALEITKTHQGNFTQGGSGQYSINVTNPREFSFDDLVAVEDFLPAGLTAQSITATPAGLWTCEIYPGPDPDLGFRCNNNGNLPGGSVSRFVFNVTVDQDAPCSVTNTVNVSALNLGLVDTASDPTVITGGTCGGNGGNGGGGSTLPINLNGIFTMFNNISTNNNINSPGAPTPPTRTSRKRPTENQHRQGHPMWWP